MSCSKALSPSHARRHSWPGPGLPNPGPHPPHNPLAAGRAARLVRDNPPPFSRGRQPHGPVSALWLLLMPRLPARTPEQAATHAAVLRVLLAQQDPAARADLFRGYERWHPFHAPTDPTARLFHLVSHLQKPEHRATERTWAALHRAPSPGPSTHWTLWRELCRVLAAQLAPVVQSFQRSRQSAPNQRRLDALVLRALLRLSDPDGGDATVAIQHLFELLSDLTHAIDVAHRPHFAQRLYGACTSWIQQSMRPPFAPFTPARPPVHLLALQGALYVLRKGLCPSEEASPLHAPPALAHTVSAFAQLFCALHAPDLAQRRRQLAALRDRVEADALLSMHREDTARALQGLLSVCLHDGGRRADGPGGPGGPGHGRPGRHAP